MTNSAYCASGAMVEEGVLSKLSIERTGSCHFGSCGALLSFAVR